MRRRLVTLCLVGLLAAPASADETESLVRDAVWGTRAEQAAALARLKKMQTTPELLARVEKTIRAGRTYPKVAETRETVTVRVPGGQTITLQVQLPVGYTTKRRYPLMLAMGGGPLPSKRYMRDQARHMLRIWSKPARDAGWIVAAVEDGVSVVSQYRPLRYPILHDGYADAIFRKLRERYRVDADRVHATGVSLGANYSQSYAEAHPHWFAGIFPVSTEGDSRELCLRNINQVSVYVVEGARDRNIKSIEGPRKMARILKSFGYRHVYDEHAGVAHEAFEGEYPKAIDWLDKRAREPFPKRVIRVAHPGIILPARRFYWVGADTHQAFFRARVTGNKIEVDAARCRELTFYLSDRLLDLDDPVVIVVNGRTVHEKKVARSLLTAVRDAARTDERRYATASVTVGVPDLAAGESWVKTALAPKIAAGELAHWESYAMATLKERRSRFPATLAKGEVRPGLAGQIRLVVKDVPDGSPLRVGDELLEVSGEPFFTGGDPVAFLDSWLRRGRMSRLDVKLRRDGKERTVRIAVK